MYLKAIYFVCINGKNEWLLKDYFSVELFAVNIWKRNSFFPFAIESFFKNRKNIARSFKMLSL